MGEIINSEEAARILGISRGYLYKYMRDGQLQPIEKESVLSRRPRLEFVRKDVEELRRRLLEAKSRDARRLQPAS
jgi:predicted site-specific integrase-resolvase